MFHHFLFSSCHNTKLQQSDKNISILTQRKFKSLFEVNHKFKRFVLFFFVFVFLFFVFLFLFLFFVFCFFVVFLYTAPYKKKTRRRDRIVRYRFVLRRANPLKKLELLIYFTERFKITTECVLVYSCHAVIIWNLV